MPIADFDKPYREALLRLPESLAQSYRLLIEPAALSLENSELSEAILLRMNAFYRSQAATKAFLGKQKATAAADFFVEGVLFYLKAFIEILCLSLRAASELPIERKRRALRPDISVWRDKELVRAIECKTQLGWNRSTWDRDFTDRQASLKSSFPNAQAFLLVLTGQNWTGFEHDPRLGAQLFVLSKLWPTDIAPREVRSAIQTPIEPLFRAIMHMDRRPA